MTGPDVQPIPKQVKKRPKQGLYGRGAKGRATKAHAELVRSRGHCQNCGAMQGLECAHIVSRRHAATRTDEGNAFCLCHACHRRFTERAVDWVMFIDATIGRSEYERLRAKADAGVKANDNFWDGEVVRLRALLAQAGAA